VFNSFPDMSDNSFALFLHVIEKYPKKQTIWLVKDFEPQKYHSLIQNYTGKKNYSIKNRDSLIGIYYYLRAKYVFFTHGLLNGSNISKQHCVVNLWHGMPLKTIGLLANDTVTQKSTFAIATSQSYKTVIANAFGINQNNVLISGQPRNDLLFTKNNCLQQLNIDTGNKIILWTPTYRQSIVGDIRCDGTYSDNLPVIQISELKSLDIYLNSISSHLILKLHPMDILNNKNFFKYNNITIVKKGELEKVNCQLNSLLSNVDILLTDFSSIYVDFLLLDRPIGFVLEDFDSYSNSRGFVFDSPLEYMPGEPISSLEDLKKFLHDVVILKKDIFKEKRLEVNQQFNIIEPSYSQKILHLINFE